MGALRHSDTCNSYCGVPLQYMYSYCRTCKHSSISICTYGMTVLVLNIGLNEQAGAKRLKRFQYQIFNIKNSRWREDLHNQAPRSCDAWSGTDLQMCPYKRIVDHYTCWRLYVSTPYLDTGPFHIFPSIKYNYLDDPRGRDRHITTMNSIKMKDINVTYYKIDLSWTTGSSYSISSSLYIVISLEVNRQSSEVIHVNVTLNFHREFQQFEDTGSMSVCTM